MTTVPAPAVDVTIHVRYPLPRLTPDHVEFGIGSVAELVAEELGSVMRDPEELVELLESGRSTVSYEYEIDSPDHEFEGGEVTDGQLRFPSEYLGAPRDFHGLGEQ